MHARIPRPLPQRLPPAFARAQASEQAHARDSASLQERLEQLQRQGEALRADAKRAQVRRRRLRPAPLCLRPSACPASAASATSAA
jgi:hypothetical protein